MTVFIEKINIVQMVFFSESAFGTSSDHPSTVPVGPPPPSYEGKSVITIFCSKYSVIDLLRNVIYFLSLCWEGCVIAK